VHGRAPARLACAALVLASLALAGCTGGDDTATPATSTAAAAPATPAVPAAPATLQGAARLVRREHAGIPQKSLLLGSPRAPVTVVEYLDPTCAACIAAHRGLVRALVGRYVVPGVASLEARLLASDAPARGLARSVFAAGRQGSGWDMLQLGALRAPARGGTPADGDARLAAALGLDLAAWRRDRALPRWRTELLADANVATVARFKELPVFLVRGRDATNEEFTVVARPGSVDELADAIEAARR
jgi:hypothetical protein